MTLNKIVDQTIKTRNNLKNSWGYNDGEEGNGEKILEESGVKIPSLQEVIDEKDWVDNGSRL